MRFLSPVFVLLLAFSAQAQWNPSLGQWGKEKPDDLRVMTWNVQDTLCSSNPKLEMPFSAWEALARIVASLKPDVLILQECGDNSGNGTGSGADSTFTLSATLELFIHGGIDPFLGGSVTAYVQKYAPSFDLPYVFVSAESDGWNRNCILSRYPFADLNGDGKSEYSDMPILLPDKYATGFDGGLRGFGIAEIDLPDSLYVGDVVVGNSHLKAGSSSSDHAQRIDAAQNIAYFIDHFYNGAGTGMVDPNNVITDNPPATNILDADTVVIAGGDWNEDEGANGTKGPADWITMAQIQGGTSDGTDKDGSDMVFDGAIDLAGNSHSKGTSKLDYLSWQDSVVGLTRDIIFNSSTIMGAGGQFPPELMGFQTAPSLASGMASDHRPVVADLTLPLVPGGSCNQSAVNLGFAKAGSGGLVPEFEVCGVLAPGSTAEFRLTNAVPFSLAYPVIGFVSLPLPFKGGFLVPNPPIILTPLPVNVVGSLVIPGVDGGLGPLVIVMQWGIVDSGATHGVSLSNALQVTWL